MLFRISLLLAFFSFFYCSVEGQPFYIKGSQYALRNRPITFVVVPRTIGKEYKWAKYYPDSTVQRISPEGRDTVVYYTTSNAKSGIITCEVFDSLTSTLLQTVTFPLTVIDKYVDASSLAALSAKCANISNDDNECQTNYIDYFELKDIKFNNNGCVVGGFQDLTSSGYTTELDMGLKYTVTLQPKKLYLNAVQEYSKLYYGLWLDYNNDGDFEDPGEFIKDGESNEVTANIINIEILNNDSYAGSRRLRVGMNSSSGFSPSSACTIISAAGELEDYLVTINKVGALYGPNLLTPNNDGFNDFLVIKGLDPDESKIRLLEVFDTFGQKVRTMNKYNNDFDATDDSGKLLSEGIYYYYFTNESRKLKSYFQINY